MDTGTQIGSTAADFLAGFLLRWLRVWLRGCREHPPKKIVELSLFLGA
jgi:hypothetical protein